LEKCFQAYLPLKQSCKTIGSLKGLNSGLKRAIFFFLNKKKSDELTNEKTRFKAGFFVGDAL
jgi:hypothetical protein